MRDVREHIMMLKLRLSILMGEGRNNFLCATCCPIRGHLHIRVELGVEEPF